MTTETRIVALAHAVILICLYAPAASCQDPQAGQLSAPPPIKAFSKDEHSQIEQAGDVKGRLRVTIELAQNHLDLAEKYTAQPNYESASAEIGTYHALIENALTYLNSQKRDNNKTRDLYKKLELILRADGPRLTSMRRITPLEYAVWIKEVEDFARQGRTEALNSFYGHTVVRDGEKADADKHNDKPKEAPTPKSQQP